MGNFLDIHRSSSTQWVTICDMRVVVEKKLSSLHQKSYSLRVIKEGDSVCVVLTKAAAASQTW